MRREEFLRKLEMLLNDISEEERAEAMAFYRSYFEDAGIGKEERILAELGSPEEVAEIIKRDLGMVTVAGAAAGGEDAGTTGERYQGANQNYSEYQEAGTSYTWTQSGNQGQSYNQGQTYNQRQSYTMYDGETKGKDDEKRTMWIVLWVLLAIFTFPLWIGFVMGAFGVVFGLSVTLIAFTFAMFAMGIAFVGVGIPMALGISGAAGVAFIGAGLLVLALAILLLNACVWIFGKVFPWAIKGIGQLFKKVFGKGKETQTV